MTTHLGLQRILLPSAQVSQLTTGSITLPSARGAEIPLTPFQSISSTTLSTTQSSITFSGIPSTFAHLQIRGIARTTGYASHSHPIFVTVNGDTGANYQSQGFIHNFGGIGFVGYYDNATTSIYMQRTTGDSAGSNHFGGINFSIIDYSKTNKLKTFLSEMGGAMTGATSNNYAVGPVGGTWRSTDAITSITLTPQYGSWSANTRFSLYGIKGE